MRKKKLFLLKKRIDYYPFGMPMPSRYDEGDYPYAYQGQEKDVETGMEAFELRLWDARIGRWLTTDPAGQYSSPYLGMGNNPVNRVDPDGGTDDWIYNPDTDSYYWDESVTLNDQSSLQSGHQYVGADRNDITTHFNSNNPFLSIIFNPTVDNNSFYNAKFTLLTEVVIEANRNRTIRTNPISSNDEFLNKWKYGPDDQIQPTQTISSYKINIDFLPKGFQGHNFPFSMTVNNETFEAIGSYEITNPSIQHISKVSEGKNLPQTYMAQYTVNSLVLGNTDKTVVVVITFKSRDAYHKVRGHVFK